MRSHPVFAAFYDLMERRAEDSWLGRLRAELVSPLDGRVLEIGAGTGSNLPHYRAASDVVLAEPDRAMRRRLERRLGTATVAVSVVDAPAEALPFPDASFDTVVSTLVLCSVDDLGRALAEVRRVLRPEGRFVFFEHVRADGRYATLQDAVTPVWRHLGAGCHPNRDIVGAVRRGGFTVDDSGPFLPSPSMPIARPFVKGVATPVS